MVQEVQVMDYMPSMPESVAALSPDRAREV